MDDRIHQQAKLQGQRKQRGKRLREELKQRGKRLREEHRPAILTLAVTALFLVSYLVLWGLGELNIKGTEEAFIDSFGYHLWAAMAALSVTLWVVLFIAGLRENEAFGKDLGVNSWETSDWTAKWLLYFVFIIIGGVLLWAIQQGTRPPIPIGWWNPWSYVLVLVGAVAAGPWVLLVWRAHARLHLVDTGSATSIRPLTSIWSRIQNSMLALSLLVTSATLTTGALRIAVTSKGKPAAGGKFEPFVKLENYPSSHVLLFGAFFTVLLAVAVFPLVVAWRGKARCLVDRLAPVEFESASSDSGEGKAAEDAEAGKPANDAGTAKTADDKRSKLEKHLNLDTGIFQSPLTGLSVLTPLLTSVLAVFLPELTK